MTIWLKQSTAAVIPFGPAVDKTDGVTLETGLVTSLDHASTGIKLSKNGGAFAVRHATVTATTYDSYGMYLVTLDTTDTNTLGRLSMVFSEAGTCLPVWVDIMVAPANVWDSMFGADYLQVDMTQILGTAVSSPATAGILDVNLKNIANAAVSTTTAQLGVNVVQISTDATAADNAELFFDGTGYAGGTTKLGVDVVAVSGDTAAADALETMLDGTGGNVLSLKQLNIVATGDDSAIVATGSGTGSGIFATGGATGHGYKGWGGATSGHGMYLFAQGSNGSGLYAIGDTDGAGITANGGSGNGSGMNLAGSGSGSGLYASSDGSGSGLKLYGGAAGGAALHLEGDAGEDLKLVSANTSGLKVNSFSDDALTAAAIATDAFGADALAAAFVDEIIDEVIEGTTTLRQAIRVILADAAGKADGGGSTTVHFRNQADDKNRITATVDANGNRTAVTLDLT